MERAKWPTEFELLFYQYDKQGTGDQKRLDHALHYGKIDLVIMLSRWLGHTTVDLVRGQKGRVPYMTWPRGVNDLAKELPKMVAQSLPEKLAATRRIVGVQRPASTTVAIPKPTNNKIEVIDISTPTPAPTPPPEPVVETTSKKRGKSWSPAEVEAMQLAVDECRDKPYFAPKAYEVFKVLVPTSKRTFGAFKQVIYEFRRKNPTLPSSPVVEPVVVASPPPVTPTVETPPIMTKQPEPTPTPVDARQTTLKLVPDESRETRMARFLVKLGELQRELEPLGLATAFVGASGRIDIKGKKKKIPA